MDTECYERVTLQLKNRLYSYSRMLLRDTAEAQDVAQEALIRMWEHRETIDERGARSWLLRTAHNLCIDRVRRARVRSEVDDGDETLDRQPGGELDPQRLAASSELGRRIESCLQRLPVGDRAVVILREVHGMPYEEIANALDVPLGTLKARLHRAREKLRTGLVRAGVAP